MPRDASRASLYRGKINLWVEDETTRSYLAALWTDPDILFLIGGGNDGVKAIVKDAERAGFQNVFGVVDRDLRASNRDGWAEASRNIRTFVLPAHEIENYLLDPAALAACPYNNRGHSPRQIEGFLNGHAGRLCWWVACCDVVAELKQRFRDGFMENPKYPNVAGEMAAINHILNDAWFQKLDQEKARSTPDDVRQLMIERHRAASGRLGDGSWRIEFAGKEILRHVGTQIVDWTKMSRPATKVEFESDLAKEVADWQVKNGAVPPDLVDLRSALKTRIRRPEGRT